MSLKENNFKIYNVINFMTFFCGLKGKEILIDLVMNFR